MMTDIEQMKAELEASGYRFFAWGSSEEVYAPNGWHFETSYHYGDASEWWSQFENAKQRLIKAAYAHLQERKELEALEAYVLARRTSDPIADDIVNEYNITADDESDDDE